LFVCTTKIQNNSEIAIQKGEKFTLFFELFCCIMGDRKIVSPAVNQSNSFCGLLFPYSVQMAVTFPFAFLKSKHSVRLRHLSRPLMQHCRNDDAREKGACSSRYYCIGRGMTVRLGQNASAFGACRRPLVRKWAATCPSACVMDTGLVSAIVTVEPWPKLTPCSSWCPADSFFVTSPRLDEVLALPDSDGSAGRPPDWKRGDDPIGHLPSVHNIKLPEPSGLMKPSPWQ